MQMAEQAIVQSNRIAGVESLAFDQADG